jgi:hypothetical protein
MPHRLTIPCCLMLAGLALPGAASAQHTAPSAPNTPVELSERARRRYPQAVRAGDLIRRQVLRPIEAQHVLGRVAALVRRPDGMVLVVINMGGLLGFGTRPVAVPLQAVALLGTHVALMDVTPEQLRALPDFEPTGTTPVPPGDTLRVGLTRPFH